MKIADCCYSCMHARDELVPGNPMVLRCVYGPVRLLECYRTCENFKRNPRLK